MNRKGAWTLERDRPGAGQFQEPGAAEGDELVMNRITITGAVRRFP